MCIFCKYGVKSVTEDMRVIPCGKAREIRLENCMSITDLIIPVDSRIELILLINCPLLSSVEIRKPLSNLNEVVHINNCQMLKYLTFTQVERSDSQIKLTNCQSLKYLSLPTCGTFYGNELNLTLQISEQSKIRNFFVENSKVVSQISSTNLRFIHLRNVNLENLDEIKSVYPDSSLVLEKTTVKKVCGIFSGVTLIKLETLPIMEFDTKELKIIMSEKFYVHI